MAQQNYSTRFLLLCFFAIISGLSQAQQKDIAAPSDWSTYQAPVFADTKRIEKIKKLIPAIEKIYKEYAIKNNFPGFAFGIVADNQLLYAGNYGFTELKSGVKTTSQSLFRIASMSKSFAALAILKLRDEGKLQLDDEAAAYIPELKNIPLLTRDAPPITIRNLMTHTAGFPEDNPWGDRQLDVPDSAFMAMLNNAVSFSNVSGITYEYSNMGFAMLGTIITKVSGRPYQQYITEEILVPLGMKNTVWEYSAIPEALLAHGYRREENQFKEETLLHDGAYGVMGGLISSVEDFSKYMQYFIAAWPPANNKETGPVKRSSVREMQQPWSFNNLSPQFKYPSGRACAMVSSYGYGLRISQDCENRKYIGHTGGLPGFGSQWWVMPEYGIGVVALGNLTYASMGNVNWAVLDTLIKAAALEPRQTPASPILQLRKKQLEELLPQWQNAVQSDIFAVNFFPDISLQLRKQKTDSLFKTAGKIRRISKLQAQNQLRGTFTLHCERADIEVYFTLSPENPALMQYLDFSIEK